MILNKHEVGFLVDGSFLPLRNGTNYSIYSLMNSLAHIDGISPNLIISYRGWDKPELYQDQNFRTIFLASRDRYKNRTTMDYVLSFHNIRFLHLYNAEEVIELAPRLKNLGIKIIYEAVNIDHVLYARLAADNTAVRNMKRQQTEAMRLADDILCRSEIDKHHIFEMGIDSKKVSVYRGAIDTHNIVHQTRIRLRYKLVFLGHMYYPPNENALKLIADKILPELRKIDNRYTVTVIGIIAPSIRDEYSKKGILFRDGVDDLSGELLDYDIALCPLLEGSGTRLKVLDFLSSGLPVISTTLGIEGLHPQIQDCVVIEDDINQYAQTIHQLAMNLPSYDKMAQKGREYVESYYDWHNNLEPFLNLYQKS